MGLPAAACLRVHLSQTPRSPLPTLIHASIESSQIGKLQNFLAFGWLSAFGAAIELRDSGGFSRRGAFHGHSVPRQHGPRLLLHHRSTFQKRNILQSNRMAGLFIDALLHYRQQRKYMLHEFVVMPDHFHLLITPIETLERSMQLIKGGFSYRARKELGFAHQIWQPSYYDRRMRNLEEYFFFREYIRRNPVKRGLGVNAEDYLYSSARPGIQSELDGPPPRLKPVDFLSA